ncbi:mandelate racemase/muconate lactonizing enzyme family protein [Maritalea sp.]|uniref:mandelate racemase/muconate lactonizing enzyme family protein n=1 Tax=Maritalea sp. TaxID=2003361 RepID=UPI003EFA2973
MKIAKVIPYIVSQSLGEQSFCYAQAWYNTRTIMLLEIVTEDGLSGFGEAFGNAHINKSVIDHAYKDRLIGQNVFDNGLIWDDLYNSMRNCGQKGSAIQALSAVDNALWDLKGKYTKLPVYRLIGGARRKRLVPYATGLYHSASVTNERDLVGEAVGYAQSGFRAMKMKIGFGVENDKRMVRAIRSAIGDSIDLMVDANHAYNACTAISLARDIEQYNIKWFEEPVPSEDIKGYQEVKAATTIPIAGGETEFTSYGFQPLIAARAVDIVQPDCCVAGGLTEFQKIVQMAKLENIQCCPHVWGGAVALSVGLNAAFAMPDFPESLNPADVFLEYDRSPNVFRDELSRTKLTMRDGYIDLPEFEGLGVDIDRDVIAKYQIC